GIAKEISHTQIALAVGISESTVRRRIKKLEKLGLIEIRHHRGDRCDYLILDSSRHNNSGVAELPQPVPSESGASPGERLPVLTEHSNKEYKRTEYKIKQTIARPSIEHPEFNLIKGHITAAYCKVNQLPFCPWTEAESRALCRLLGDLPQLTQAIAARCVDHYFRSIRSRSC